MAFFPGSWGGRAAVLILVAAATGGGIYATRAKVPDLPTVEVRRGDFTEIVETRGDVRPLRSIVVTAPYSAGELQILEIQRERADRARRYAEGNAELMAVHAPFSGLVVLKQVWKGNNQAEVAEGEEVRPGIPVLDIVDPASMQVRARVSQADVSLISPGQTAKIRLDAYPDLLFNGKIEAISPLGVQSSMTAKVRNFTAVVSIQGMDPQLMPDLSASVEIAIARKF